MAVPCTAAAVLSLLSLTAAAPSGCEDALTPLETVNHSQIFGKWFLHAVSSNNKEFQSLAGGLKSFWMELQPGPENHTTLLKTATQGNESCDISTSTITSTTLFGFKIGHDMKLQLTRPTCLFILTNHTVAEKPVILLYIYGRTQKLGHSHMDTFRRRTDCLGLEFSLTLDPEKDVCPEKEDKVPTSPPACEDLFAVLHSVDRAQIFGKWFLIGAASNYSSTSQNYTSSQANVDSIWIKLSPTSHNDTILLEYGSRQHGSCWTFSQKHKITSHIIAYGPVTAMELLSCPNCLLLRVKHSTEEQTVQHLQIWGRTRTLPDSVMDTFRRQVNCLDLGLQEFMDPEKDVCPEKEISSTK